MPQTYVINIPATDRYQNPDQLSVQNETQALEALSMQLAQAAKVAVDAQLVASIKSSPAADPSEALWSSTADGLRLTLLRSKAGLHITTVLAASLRLHPLASRLCLTVLPEVPLRSDGLDAAHACLTPASTRSYAAKHRECTDGDTGCVAEADSPGLPAGLPAFHLAGAAPGVEYRVQAAVMDMRGKMHRVGGAVILETPVELDVRGTSQGARSREEGTGKHPRGRPAPETVRGQAGIPLLTPVWDSV